MGEMVKEKEDSGSRKSLEVEANATPSPSSHCFNAEDQRAEHWLRVWENFWSGK